MEKSSHYYTVLALCLIKGVKKETAHKIAYASQFVDDAKINKIVFKKKYSGKIFGTDVNGKCILYDISSCHSYFTIKTFNYQSMMLNTVIFHFFPRNKKAGVEKFTRKIRCGKDPKILKNLIIEITKEKRLEPEKFGMLLHVYADTFSHQGFSGLLCLENNIINLKPIKKFSFIARIMRRLRRKGMDAYFDKFVPAYGHAKAFTNPDVPVLKWSYKFDGSTGFWGDYKKSDRDNAEEYKNAFNEMAKLLEGIKDSSVFEKLDPGKETELLELFYGILKKDESNEKKIKTWQKFIIESFSFQKNDKILKYDEDEWVREAFTNHDKKIFHSRVVEKALFAKDYENTSWYKFINAVHWYKHEILKRLEEDGLKIPV